MFGFGQVKSQAMLLANPWLNTKAKTRKSLSEPCQLIWNALGFGGQKVKM
jgi:hypothetical protein